MKKNHVAMAIKAAELKNKIEAFLDENKFQAGELTLELSYNPWHKSNGGLPYEYYLKKGASQSIRFTFEELNALKTFLNSVKLIES